VEPAANTIEPVEDEAANVAPGSSATTVAPRSRVPLAGALNRARDRFAGTAGRYEQIKFALLVYLTSRLLLLILAIVEGAVRHHPLGNEFSNWDGMWYRWLANAGYPHHVIHARSTLGFFPAYPIVIWLFARPLLLVTSHSSIWAITWAGVFVSNVGGLVATVLIQRLATGWWGQSSGRRAAALFCMFPGSVVFSMVYAEGILIPLAIGCILALQSRRWLLAGVLAAFATASEPEALVLIPVCAVSAGLELRRHGWDLRTARRSLLAPLGSLCGVGAVAGFFWAWAGTPFASLQTQHYGWHERTDPLAIPRMAVRLSHEISFSHFNHPTINLNLPVGLVGTILLVVLLILMARVRREISIEAIVWTLGISLIAVTSEYVWPNPRILITAFPAVIVLARFLKGRAYYAVLGVNVALLGFLSWLTFVHVTLRP
jgi:hypothetical protein